jgi:hypothetical protein
MAAVNSADDPLQRVATLVAFTAHVVVSHHFPSGPMRPPST